MKGYLDGELGMISIDSEVDCQDMQVLLRWNVSASSEWQLSA